MDDVTPKVDWATCSTPGCVGVRVDDAAHCFAHSEDALQRTLEMLGRTGDVDARGVVVTPELLFAFRQRLPRDPLGRVTLEGGNFKQTKFHDADFSQFTFGTNTTFRSAEFFGDCSFEATTFLGDPVFDGSHFDAGANFLSATFTKAAGFNNTTFGPAYFGDVSFQGGVGFFKSLFSEPVNFFGARFLLMATFQDAVFYSRADFSRADFQGLAAFQNATFEGKAFFRRSTFHGLTRLDGVCFEDEARFEEASFVELCRRLGPFLCLDEVFMSGITCASPMRLTAASRKLSIDSAQFIGGVDIKVRGADLRLDDAYFGRPSSISQATHGIHAREDELADASARPRVLSMRRAHAGQLVLSELDLQECRFHGAHNLDGLRIEGQSVFSGPPPGWHFGVAWPPVWRWSARLTLAEERQWRQASRKRAGWGTEQTLAMNVDGDSLGALDVARIYRALRKGREDVRDEPGAADFYWGEMEMRRMAARSKRPSAESAVLGTYWLLSGYGLRATRPIGWLILLILTFTVMFHGFGFADASVDTTGNSLVSGPNVSVSRSLAPQKEESEGEHQGRLSQAEKSWADSALYTLETATALFVPRSTSETDQKLTRPGRVLRVGLRILAPLILAAFLLAIRSRVRR